MALSLRLTCMGVVLTVVAAQVQAGAVSRSVSRHTMAPNAVQFFDQGEIEAGHVLFGITTPFADLPFSFDVPDTVAATFFSSDVGPGDISGSTLTFNNDSDADTNPPLDDNALSSLFRLEAPTTAEYTVGVTGHDNFFDDFPHAQQGDYFLTVGVVDPSTTGGDFADTDGTNETQAGADVLNLGVNEAQVAVNTLTAPTDPGDPGDVDFYSVALNAGDMLTVMTAPLDDLPIGFGLPDTMIIFFDDQGTILFDDDEASDNPTFFGEADFTDFLGPHDGSGSAAHFLAPYDGVFSFAITAYEDEFATGDHDDFGDYGLLVSRTVPEPASLALLGLGGITLMRRRRAHGQSTVVNTTR